MHLHTHLTKSKKQERPPSIFKETDNKPHRPKKRYTITINSEEDARKANKSNIPILYIDSSHTKMLRYPMTIPETIVVPREYKDSIKTSLNLHTFESLIPFKDTTIPSFEDVVVFMLTLDPLAARGMVDRSDLDLQYLTKRILQENLEKEASDVYLHDHLELPVQEPTMDKNKLLKVIDRNKISEVVP
ncbi:MAG: hypothetical protein ACQESD_06975 [Thermoplasmatota archaeon]